MQSCQPKWIIAPDSFKGSLTAIEAADIIAKIAEDTFGVQAVCAPIADGGEGTLDALLASTRAQVRTASVENPLGETIRARFGLSPRGALIELAESSGLTLLPADRRNPLLTSTRGLGQVLLRALEGGAQNLLIGLGGSATNDGGMGMLAELGARFTDCQGDALHGNGSDLEKVAQVDLSGLNPALRSARVTVMCDVSNPLLGAQGATAVYGPQKGGTPEQLASLESGMRNYARHMSRALGVPFGESPGSGAAGGVGAALRYALGAQLQPGIDAVLDAIDFDRLLDGASLVITGEGRLDAQSVQFGKAPIGVFKRCLRRNVPVAILAGALGEGAQQVFELGDCALASIQETPMSLQEAMERAPELLARAAERLFYALRLGAAFGNARACPPASPERS